MRTLQEIDADLDPLIKAVAKLADELDQISPNPIKVKITDKEMSAKSVGEIFINP